MAIDFSEGSIHAVKLARHLLADGGEMYLLYVAADIQLSIEGCAQRVGADLLAVGSDYHSPLSRLFAGSVSMGLAHSARWSTLVVPSRSDD